MDSRSTQPTVVYDSAHGTAAASSRAMDVSRPKVGFVAGDRPHFTDETAALLRSRLTAATLAMATLLAAAFLGSVASGIFTLWWLRVVVLVALASCFFVLRGRRQFTLGQLQIVELVVFGLVVLQVSLMLASRINEFAEMGDATSVVAVKYLFLGAWCLLILLYGIFVPNTWRRGATVMLPAACLPYLVLALQQYGSPKLAALLAQDHAGSPVPLPLMAALVGIYGAHVINAARREAFKARQFGQYRLLEKLGSGGMGEVYKAEHVLLKRPCAMKLIKPANEADATATARFEKEVQATAKLTHWNTVEIYDYGHTDDGTFYYVMELLPGMSLETLVERSGPLPPARAVHLLRQVCRALHEAHGIGLIHRDLKPANIFAAQRGGVWDVAKLLDFGLVKEQATGESDGGRGGFSGTPLYMAPEQATAYDEVDGRADIYALGAVAYHLLTGTPPFSGKNVVQLLVAHASRNVPAPTSVNHQIPPDVERVVLQCMAKDPDDRYQDAASLESAWAACACAHDWTDAMAADWWAGEAQRDAGQGGAAPPTDATVDFAPHQTTPLQQ